METRRSLTPLRLLGIVLISFLAISCGPDSSRETDGAGEQDATSKSLGMSSVALNGIVKDSLGNPIPNVMISLTSEEATVRDIGAMTNAEGRFLFGDLQPATYTIVAVLGERRVDTDVDLGGADVPEEVVIIFK